MDTANQASLAFASAPPTTLPIEGQAKRFPIRRIFCVGRNYADHAKEMGHEVDREAPFYFLKLSDAVAQNGATIPYPPGTEDCHFEGELVVALASGGFRVSEADAMGLVYGYAAGIDLTRRDLQGAAKKKGRPWDFGKAFENGAILGSLTPKADFGEITNQRIMLKQNGEVRQDAHLSDLIWSLEELISYLSRFYHLEAGDLIFTGTPAGVGPIASGDRLEVEIEGLTPLCVSIGAAE